MSVVFALDPRLAADTLSVGTLPLCDLRLMNDSRFPWLVLVPRRVGRSEIVDLNGEEQTALMAEIVAVSGLLRTVTACDKLNVGALGNIVRQLHVHIVARFASDAAWPGPVWGQGKAVAYDPAAATAFIDTLRDLSGLA
ncbi:MAG: HIT family protein [Bauldia sp.]